MAKISDYGGNNYGGRAACGKVTKESCRSFHCLDCGTRRFVKYRELTRAARVRCLECGGTLEESDSSVRRNLGVAKKRIGTEISVSFGEKNKKCPICDQRFRTDIALMMHCEERHTGK